MHPLGHVLAAFLIVFAPIWDYFQTRRLKTSLDPRAKIHAYRKTIFWLWLCAMVAVLSSGFSTVTSIRADVSWLPRGSAVTALAAGLAAAFTLVLISPLFVIRRRPSLRAKIAKAFEPLRFFLPTTAGQRRWFAALCVTAGIAEEILFRGFLIHYFRTAPFAANLAVALILSSVIFGTEHLYQGLTGVIQTALIGLVLGTLFLLSGNILLPAILHTIIDLRALLLLQASAEPEPA